MDDALKTSRAGTSPGPDGIPLAVYRKSAALLAPVLARVYSAMLRTFSLPPAFHEGVVVYLSKGGDRTEPSQYRPITLLNTAYRVLAKVLTGVLAPALQHVVGPSQTAFLPGRRIGDTILHLQATQALLGQRGFWGLAVFADFTKAYDTVRRSFLIQAMSAMGMPAAFCSAVELLLTETWASACVGGVVSDPARFDEGLRQGCPLAPLLYLFVAEALATLLADEHTGTAGRIACQLPAAAASSRAPARAAQGSCGVVFAGPHEVSATTMAPQYADDITPIVFGGAAAEASTTISPTPACVLAYEFLACVRVEQRVQLLLSALSIFGDASGQRLHPAKTTVLPIGVVPRSLRHAGGAVAGLSISSVARTLGTAFVQGDGGVVQRTAVGQPHPEWSPEEEAALRRVETCCTTIHSRRSLSLFGRAMASAAYGTSQLLYALEFRLAPPSSVFDRLRAALQLALSPGASPAGRAGAPPRHTALPALEFLQMPPRDGGVGGMVWQRHILARHAVWAARAICCPTLPWVGLFQLLLAGHGAGSVVSCFHLAGPAAGELPPSLLPGCGSLAEATLPSLVARLVWGARQLGSPVLVSPSTLPSDAGVGPRLRWLLPGPVPRRVHVPPPPRAAASSASRGPTAASPPGAAAQALHASRRRGQPGQPGADPVAVDIGLSVKLAAALIAAEAGVPARRLAFWGQVVAVLGGEYHDGEVPAHLPVPTARASLRPPPSDAAKAAASSALWPLFRQVWRLRMDNRVKEVWWMLILNGLKTAARLHVHRPCPCGALVVPGRPHTFWACPVAAAVVATIQRSMPHPQAPLAVRHFWLLEPPAPTLHVGLWHVIALCAIAAMEHGRRTLARLTLSASSSSPGHARPVPSVAGSSTTSSTPLEGDAAAPPGTSSDNPGPRVAGRLRRAQRAALGYFSRSLGEFAALNDRHPGPFTDAQAADHPILRPVERLDASHGHDGDGEPPPASSPSPVSAPEAPPPPTSGAATRMWTITVHLAPRLALVDSLEGATPAARAGVLAAQQQLHGLRAPDLTPAARAAERAVASALVEVGLRPLTPAERAAVDRALAPGPVEQLAARTFTSFGALTVTRTHMECLRPGMWLNDEVINYYLGLLLQRELARRPPSCTAAPRVHVFSTFFFAQLSGAGGLSQYNFEAVRRWSTPSTTGGYCILDCDILLVPVHLGVHWVLAVAYLREGRTELLDSLGGRPRRVLDLLARYVADAWHSLRGLVVDTSGWLHTFPQCARQRNGFDCGVFMLMHADYQMRRCRPAWSQAHMPYFRRRIAADLLAEG